jgi:hypothetical protein
MMWYLLKIDQTSTGSLFLLVTKVVVYQPFKNIKMVEAKQVKEFALEEVQGHTSSSDCWLVIGNASNGASRGSVVGDQTCSLLGLYACPCRGFFIIDVREEHDDDDYDDVRMKAT